MTEKTSVPLQPILERGHTAGKRRLARNARPAIVAQPKMDPVSVCETTEQQNVYLDFGSADEMAKDDSIWRAKIADTPDEKLAELEHTFIHDEDTEECLPLDFKGR